MRHNTELVAQTKNYYARPALTDASSKNSISCDRIFPNSCFWSFDVIRSAKICTATAASNISGVTSISQCLSMQCSEYTWFSMRTNALPCEKASCGSHET